MTQRISGKAQRKDVTLVGIFRRFPDDATADAELVRQRWPHGIVSPHCGSTNVKSGAKHETIPHRCREMECAKRFSPNSGAVMEGSRHWFQTWMAATCLLTASFKRVSSMKLHRDLGISQSSAWLLAHRWQVAPSVDGEPFSDPKEVDETCIGGRHKNMGNARRKALKGMGTGAVDNTNTAVVGVKDRAKKRVAGCVLGLSTRPTSSASRPSMPLPLPPSAATTLAPARACPLTLPRSTAPSPRTSRLTCTPTESSPCAPRSSMPTSAPSTR